MPASPGLLHSPFVRHRPRHILEYALLRGVSFLVSILPYRAALFIGWLLAGTASLPARKKIVEARRRMASVMGDRMDRRAIRRAVWIAWRNLFFNAIDLMRTPRYTEENIWKIATCSGHEELVARAREGRGAVVAVCHSGNWDLAGIGLSLHGMPLFAMMRRQRNPLTDAYLNRMRTRFGMGVVERHSRALGSVIRRLKKGEVLAILPDLRSKDPATAIDVPFLNHTASLAGGMALFAWKANVPIYHAYTTRIGWTRHQWIIEEPIHPDANAHRDEEIIRLTTHVMNRMTAFILEHPEQYFWFNSRWVLEPHQPS